MPKKTVLDNGLRVVSKKLENTKAVTCLILVGAGSRYENESNSGMSHFLEHMFFKGAKKFGNTKEVSEAIDSVGGDFNAFTGKEYAGYYVKVASNHADIACDVLSDMMLHARFDQAEIEKERGVILEEYNMYQDTPMYQIGWDFERLIYGDQPMGRDQIGTKEFIKSVSHEDFVKYKESLYTPDNTVFAMAGNIDHEQAVQFAKKYFMFENIKKDHEFDGLKELETERVSVKEKKTEQAHVVVGMRGYATSSADYYAAKILAVLLGGNMSSRMFLNVREAQGLAYYISTSLDDYSDSGVFYTRAGVDLKRIDDAIKAIIKEYQKVADGDIPENEVTKSKEYMKGKIILRVEDSEEYAHLLAKRELLLNNIETPEDIIAKIDKVDSEALKRVAKDLMVPGNYKIAVIGPYEDDKRFEEILLECEK